MTYDLGHIYIQGRVTAGLGEKRGLLSGEHYRRRFLEEFGIDPRHGTLNLKLGDRDMLRFRDIKKREGVKILGPERGDDKKAHVKAFNCEVRGLKCAAVIIKGIPRERILELVSNHHLRDELDLEDGDRIWVKVKL